MYPKSKYIFIFISVPSETDETLKKKKKWLIQVDRSNIQPFVYLVEPSLSLNPQHHFHRRLVFYARHQKDHFALRLTSS